MTYKATPTILMYPLGGLIAGISLQNRYPLPHLLLTIATLLALTLFTISYFYEKQFWRHILSCVALFFALGAYLLSLQTTSYHKNQKILLATSPTIITGCVQETKNLYNSFYTQAITIHVQHPFSHTISCYLQYPTPLTPGDIVTLTNIALKAPKTNPTISKNPPFSHYLIKENILATLFLKKPTYTVHNNIPWSLPRWMLKKRHALFTSLKAKMPAKPFSYFASIFLGNKAGGTKPLPRHIFQYWGLSHHLARSGLHIALFILLITLALSLIPLPFTIKTLILTATCATYTLLSWTSTSFVRAISIFLLYQLGLLLNKQPNMRYILQLITLTVLIFNPMQLFFLDFQLSFGITGALAWAFHTPKNRKKAQR